MTKSTKTLNSNSLSGRYVLLAHRIKDSNPGTQERAKRGGINISGDGDGRFGPKNTVLGICLLVSLTGGGEGRHRGQLTSAVSINTIDRGIFAHLEQAAVAGFTYA